LYSGSSVTAGEIRDIREREKREMRGLNDRLAAYIEQVRFLEAQNRKLSHDLERLTKGKHAPGIRQMYEKEISVRKSAFNSLIIDQNRLGLPINKPLQICMTKRRNAVIEEECKRIRNENLKLNSDLASQRQVKLVKFVINLT
uniref:IF rod domain-containing protein n=1 Tax=Haemonchus placei TaxID=6290 RepID=A0A0N4W378_HAEPC